VQAGSRGAERRQALAEEGIVLQRDLPMLLPRHGRLHGF
jgi:hypothetical protein